MASSSYAKYTGLGGGGGGTGTVTSVSVVSANGLAGTVANPTTTPAITLSTTVTGLLKGNGTAISAQTTGDLTDAGTDGITVTGGTGAVIGAGTSIAQHVADATHNGYLNSTDWNTFNNKQGTLTLGDLTDAGTDGITVTGGTGAVVGSGTSIAQHVADSTHNGYLSSTDWSTFNNKQSALTIGNLTDAGTDGITVTSGTGAVIGSGTSIAQHVADSTHNGYLSSTDWSTFNAKQSSALTTNHILVGAAGVATDVAMSGDAGIVASGALTLATVNSNVGSFTNANITVNAKGLITAAANGSSSSAYAVTSQSTTYAALTTDNVILVDDSGGSWTLTLPTAVGLTGHLYVIQKTNSGRTTSVSIATTSAQTINGQASLFYKLNTLNESYSIFSDGANWKIQEHKTATPSQAYTPTYVGFGTIASTSAFWYRYQDRMKVYGVATAGTVSGITAMGIQMPSGIVMNTSLMATYIQVGTIQLLNPVNTNTQIPNVSYGPFPIWVDSTDTGQVYVSGHVTNNTFSKDLGNLGNNGQVFTFSFDVPITGWQE